MYANRAGGQRPSREREWGERTLIEHKWGWGAELAACSGVPDTCFVQASLGMTVYVSSVGMKIDKWKGMHWP